MVLVAMTDVAEEKEKLRGEHMLNMIPGRLAIRKAGSRRMHFHMLGHK